MSDSVATAELSKRLIPPFVTSLIERAATTIDVDVIASREYLQRAIDLLRRPAAEKPGREVAPPLPAWQVKKLLGYIDDNLAGTLCGQDLCSLVNLSVSHFSRAFKASVGLPPRQFVIRRRIERAQNLMKTTRMPLAEIALDCGLSDQSCLCRHFRRVVGKTPRQWRRDNSTLEFNI